MQVILKPTSHPDLGEIIINNTLFAIGRHEAPFLSYDPSIVARLSKRHARIFEQDGAVYIIDLGSLNGTTVNGQRIEKQPVRLQRDDEICFAGHLCYQSEILGMAASRALPATPPPPVHLILLPENPRLEPIVVSGFPFLVNKVSEVFARYRDSFPEELRYLSRRHAHIFLRDGGLYVEDLGSTNGTFISGNRLEEHARQLQDGDSIAFGGNHFVYHVKIVSDGEVVQPTGTETTGPLTGTIKGVEDVTRTTFVTSANSFLDIFCSVEDDSTSDDDAVARPEAETGGAEIPEGERRGGLRGLWRKPQSVIREIRAALAEEKEAAPRRTWLVVIVAVIFGLGLLGLYLQDAPEREVRQLLEQGEYAAGMAAADRYLAKHPDDRDVSALATEGLLKATVPAWQEHIDAGDFADALREIDEAINLNRAFPDGMSLLDLMQWVTRLEQFITERGGPESPTVIFTHESRINELLDWWDTDSKAHRRTLATITRYVPGFARLGAQVFSHLRTLQNQKSLDLVAIERLVNEIQVTLAAGNAADMQTTLTSFGAKYSKITGIDKLERDLANYLAIDGEIKAGNWVQASRLSASVEFQTPPFRNRILMLGESQLPPQEVVARYDAASEAWRAGKLDDALSRLERLKQETWGEVAARELARKRDLITEFERLRQARDSSDYAQRLLAFSNSLNPVEDVHFTEAIEGEVQSQRNKTLTKANAAFDRAREVWGAYLADGGIGARQRLEATVSPNYRRQAALLKEAFEQISAGAQLYGLLKTAYSAQWNTLRAEILKEARLQRRSLTELAMVLDASLLEGKLGLLPELSSDEGGERPDQAWTKHDQRP